MTDRKPERVEASPVVVRSLETGEVLRTEDAEEATMVAGDVVRAYSRDPKLRIRPGKNSAGSGDMEPEWYDGEEKSL